MILSFVIFIVFLLFLYAVIQPTITVEQDKQNSLDFLKTELIKKLSSNITTVTLYFDESYSLSGDCIQVSHPESGLGVYSVAKDKDDIKIGSESNPSNIKIDWAPDRFFKIFYSSEQLNPASLQGASCDTPTLDTDYTIGLIKAKQNIFESKIDQAIIEYNLDYDSLKQTLNVKESNEFSFAMKYEDNTEIGIPTPDVQTQIFVDEIAIQFVDTEANINQATLIIRIW